MNAEIVRLIHGDEHPEGPGFIEEVVPTTVSGTHAAHRQFVDIGSRVDVDDPTGLLDLKGADHDPRVHLPDDADEGPPGDPVALGDPRDGRLRARHQHRGAPRAVGGRRPETDAIAAEVPLLHHTWYFVAATYDPGSGDATIRQQAVVNPYNGRLGKVAPFDHTSHVRQKLRVKALGGERPFRFGGALMEAEVRGTFNELRYNGKIDRCGVHGRVLSDAELDAIAAGGEPPADGLVARWDTAAGYGEQRHRRRRPRHRAERAARPRRAPADPRDDGLELGGQQDDWRLAPEQYGGDLLPRRRRHRLPAGSRPSRGRCRRARAAAATPRGITAGEHEDHIPFFVRPAGEAEGEDPAARRRRTRTSPTRTR